MSDDECKHGMTPAFCADCRGLDLPVDDWPVTVLATFPSRCPGCGDDIGKGDPITLSALGFVCRECAS